MCPYAERRGAVIYCRAAQRVVNPLTHPCLSRRRYTNCKYYKMAQKREKEAARKGAEPQARPPSSERAKEEPKPTPAVREVPEAPRPTPPAAPSQAVPRREVKTRGLTLDGRPARNCLECIYYGRKTGICLLLGVEVKDPNRPPCAEA